MTRGFLRAAALTTTLAAPALLVPRAGAQAPAPTPTPRVGPAPGAAAPTFAVESLVGTVAPIEYASNAPTVLLFFLASCPHCKHMLPHWNEAYEKRPAGVKVLGVMLDREPRAYFRLNPVAFPVVHAADPREVGRLFNVTKVPLVVRVGASRTVEDVEAGPAEPARLAQLFKK